MSRSLTSVVVLVAILGFCPTFGHGAEATLEAAKEGRAEARPEGLLLAHSTIDLKPDVLQKRAAMALLGEGAGRYDRSWIEAPAALTPAGLGWLGSAPLDACAGEEVLPRTAFDRSLEAFSDDLLFGEFDKARAATDDLLARLPCIDSVLDAGRLHRLWFLRSALEYLEGRPSEAGVAMEQAVVIDPSGPFDPSFPEGLQELLLTARADVLARPKARIVVGVSGALFYVNGSGAAFEDGVAYLEVSVGTHLLQLKVGDRVETRRIKLDGLAVRPDVPILTVVDAAGLSRGVTALAAEPSAVDGLAGSGRAALLCWMAQRGAPWALAVHLSGGGKKEILEADGVAGRVRGYGSGPDKGDIYTLRARLGPRVGYRLLRVGFDESTDERRSYVDASLMLWARLSWVLRVGVQIGFGYTPNDEAAGPGESCCFLPQGGVRVRLESPSKIVRPFGEIGLLFLWPYGGESTTRSVVGAELAGGVVITPEATRRLGIEVGAGFGVAPEVGSWLSIRLGPEVRF